MFKDIWSLSIMRQCIVFALLLVAGTACNDEPNAPEKSYLAMRLSVALQSEAERERNLSVQGRETRGIEDEILRLESVIPGLGGIFIDSTGNLAVYSPAGADSTTFKSTFIQKAHTLRIRQEILDQLVTTNRVVVHAGQYPFSNLVVWQRMFMSQVTPGIDLVGVDADEFTNRLKIGVTSESAVAAVRELATRAGIPSEALLVVVEPPIQPGAGLRGTWRPTGGGIQLYTAGSGDGGVCTLGFNVTTSTGLTGLLTASHCAPGLGTGVTGTNIYQPIPFANYIIGTIQNNPAWNSTDPNCGSYTLCTPGDVMFVQYTSASTSNTRVAITTTTGINNLPGPIGVAGWWNNVVDPTGIVVIGGEPMDKVGRTTGWTRGALAATCVNVVVNLNPSVQFMVLCSNRVSGASFGLGDSGSPVFFPVTGSINDPLYPLGIAFAGAPYNKVNSEGFSYCDQDCSYYYTPFQAIPPHLGVGVVYN